ncbi:MAG TPA: ribosome maturation factor RimM [Nocardioidaceae bacterium]|jgi:16S rRNA processing protein RimM|nr:ribosome maturation factor RimM [Nocardioidaceae bacterium]
MASTEVVVGRIGKAHGIRGEVSVEVRTDEPERRFADGATLATRTPRGEEPHGTGRPHRLTVRGTRWHQSRLLVTFEEIHDRTAAEAARGLLLAVEVADDETPEDPDEFYDHQLVGLRVETTDGALVGELAAVIHGAAQDLLAIRSVEGREILVPFVSELVPTVDVPTGRIVVDDRPGLLTPAAEGEG